MTPTIKTIGLVVLVIMIPFTLGLAILFIPTIIKQRKRITKEILGI